MVKYTLNDKRYFLCLNHSPWTTQGSTSWWRHQMGTFRKISNLTEAEWHTYAPVKYSIIVLYHGLSPVRCQAIICNNAGILSIGPQGTNFGEILVEIPTFSFKKMQLEMSSARWRPFRLGLGVLKCGLYTHAVYFSSLFCLRESVCSYVGIWHRSCNGRTTHWTTNPKWYFKPRLKRLTFVDISKRISLTGNFYFFFFKFQNYCSMAILTIHQVQVMASDTPLTHLINP